MRERGPGNLAAQRERRGMSLRRYASLAALVVLALVLGTAYARAQDTNNIVRVLNEIRGLSDVEYGQLTGWAKSGTPRPAFTFSKVEQTENNILQLHSADRDPILSWLRGHGRSALHARGI